MGLDHNLLTPVKREAVVTVIRGDAFGKRLFHRCYTRTLILQLSKAWELFLTPLILDSKEFPHCDCLVMGWELLSSQWDIVLSYRGKWHSSMTESDSVLVSSPWELHLSEKFHHLLKKNQMKCKQTFLDCFFLHADMKEFKPKTEIFCDTSLKDLQLFD